MARAFTTSRGSREEPGSIGVSKTENQNVGFSSTSEDLIGRNDKEFKMAVCVAVIAKENYPLYIKAASADSELKFYYTVHTSLDVIEEKVSSSGKNVNELRELYLGLLYPTEDYKVYGYVTNTKIKFVIVVESSNTTLRDNEIRSMFRKLHNAYVDMLCNPFYIPGENITSKTFNNTVISMMQD